MAQIVEKNILDEKVLENRKVILQTVEEKYDSGYETTTHNILLPKLADDELLARYRRIKPIVSREELYFYLKRFNLKQMRNTAYLWNVERDIRGQVDMTNAKTIAEFTTYHTYGYYGMFKPSIAEVLQQIPDDILEEANAFYMLDDVNPLADWDIVNYGCHKSKVKALSLKK